MRWKSGANRWMKWNRWWALHDETVVTSENNQCFRGKWIHAIFGTIIHFEMDSLFCGFMVQLPEFQIVVVYWIKQRCRSTTQGDMGGASLTSSGVCWRPLGAVHVPMAGEVPRLEASRHGPIAWKQKKDVSGCVGSQKTLMKCLKITSKSDYP